MEKSLIKEVKLLAEQQKSDASSTYQSEFPEFRYECDMLNAAPRLLDVLCQFHAGDAAQIATIMRQMQNWYGEDKTPGYEERMKLLARMQKVASLMEADHEI